MSIRADPRRFENLEYVFLVTVGIFNGRLARRRDDRCRSSRETGLFVGRYQAGAGLSVLIWEESAQLC